MDEKVDYFSIWSASLLRVFVNNKMDILDPQSTMVGIRSSLGEFGKRWVTAEHRVSKLKEKSIENLQTEAQTCKPKIFFPKKIKDSAKKKKSEIPEGGRKLRISSSQKNDHWTGEMVARLRCLLQG